MFTTLQYSPESDALHERCNGNSKPASTGTLRLACLYCRAKKLKCSGSKPACQRCVSKRLDCTYPTRLTRSGGLKKGEVHREEQKSIPVDQSRSPNEGSTPDSTARSNDFWTYSTFSDCHDMRDIFPTPVDENQLFDTVLVSDDGSFRETGPGRAVASEPLESGSGSPRADSGPLNDDIIRNASSQPRDEAVAETNDTREAPQGQSTEEPGTAGTSEEGSLGLYFSSLESPIDWDDSALANAWLAEGSVPPNSDMAVPQRSAMREHASRPSSIASTSCNCINRTIASVEQFKSSPNTAALTETTLAAYKMSIVDCEKLLSCAHCYASTSATMLVIMVSDKLIASYQRLYARGSRSWTSESPVDPIPFEDHVAGAADVHHDQTYPPRRMSLGEYPIDCEREWAHIMALLISLQLTRIRDLLERLRVRVLATDELQMQIIQQQETRLRHIMAHFQKKAKVFVP